MSPNILLAMFLINQLAELVTRAIERGGDISEADLRAAMDRAAAADEKWAKAIAKTEDGQ